MVQKKNKKEKQNERQQATNKMIYVLFSVV